MQLLNQFSAKFVVKLLPCILIIGLVSSCASLSTRTVSVSETDIQNRIAKNLNSPITLLKIFDVTLSNPIVKLDEKTGRLSTTINANIANSLKRKPITGKFIISGTPRFDVASNTLMLSNTRIENFNIDGADAQFNKLVKTLTESFGEELFNEIPLYTVKPEDLKVGNKTYLPTEFKVVGDHLFVTLKAN